MNDANFGTVDRLPVREEIVLSWFRSACAGLRRDRFHVPFDGDIDGQGRLVSAADAVLKGLVEDLAGTHNAVVLADGRGRVITRRVPDAILQACLDRVQLAPGFGFGELDAGTNAIGTALTVGRPFVVDGPEHFADVLADIATAAAPVADPRTGDVLGVIALSCRVEDSSSLMLPVATRAAGEIEQRLLGDLSPADRTLREHFVNARRRTRNGLVSVSQTAMLSNAEAARALQPGDHERIWYWVCRAVAGDEPLPAEVPLTAGTWVVVGLEPIREAGVLCGANLRLLPPSFSGRDRARFGWSSLTPTEQNVARRVADGLTNRQVATELYVSPHTVTSHLRQIFQKLEVSSRVGLARLVADVNTTSVGGAG